MEYVIGYLIVYIIQVVLIYGLTLGYFQGKYVDICEDGWAQEMLISVSFSLVAALMPLVGLIVILNLTDWAKYGLKFK